MNARSLVRLPRRAQISGPIGFDPEDMRWIVGCACGFRELTRTPLASRQVKARHDAVHRRAEQSHPAGKGRPNGWDAA